MSKLLVSGKEITGQIGSTKEIKNPINYKFKDNNGLIGFWDFKEIINEAGIFKVRDGSGDNNYGELIGSPIHVNSQTTNLGKALQFNGIDDYINFGNPANLDFDFDKISIAFWMFSNPSDNSDAGLVGKGTSIYGTTYHTGSTVYFYIRDGSNNVWESVSQGTWHHIVGTFNGTSLLLYVDGVLQSRNDNSLYASTGTGGMFSIGKAATFFNGAIDETRIYSRVLKTEEVIGLYEQGF